MSTIAIGAIFLAALLTTLFGNLRTAIVCVYLPVTLLLAHVPQFAIPLLPDVGAQAAVGYGLLLGLAVKGGEPLGVVWHWFDALVLTLGMLVVFTSMSTELIWSGVNAVGTQFFVWVMPYYLGRIVIADALARRRALKVVIACVGFVAVLAVIEFRLWPLIYSRTLERYGLGTSYKMVLARFGFFRAQVSFDHPIDLGNEAVLLGCLIVMLAAMTGRGFRDTKVRLGLAACGVMVVCSGSFTCYFAGASALLIFGLLYYGKRPAAGLLVPGVAALVGLGILATSYLLVFDLRNKAAEGDALGGSMWVRALIVQNAWKLAQEAGYFGFGRVVRQRDLDLESVDNAYMLLLLRYGWTYLTLWVTMFFALAGVAGSAIRSARSEVERLPVVAAITGLLAMAVAMYTVWFGFVYSTLFVLLMGMTVTMSQMLRAAHARGFPVVQRAPLPPAQHVRQVAEEPRVADLAQHA